jgi:osmotically-inducible protein OsmY
LEDPTRSVDERVRRTPMSRPYPAVLSLAALLALGAPLLLASGCGGESQEQQLEEATAAVAAKREAVQEARDAVAARRQEVDEARKELEAAQAELRLREQALTEAESQVGLKATDATLFRSVQRRLLDDEELDDLAIAAKVEKGVITLEGTVPEEEARARAEEIARATPGVFGVENQVRVVPPPKEE